MCEELNSEIAELREERSFYIDAKKKLEKQSLELKLAENELKYKCRQYEMKIVEWIQNFSNGLITIKH